VSEPWQDGTFAHSLKVTLGMLSIAECKNANKQKHPRPELLEYMQEAITHPWLRWYCTENLVDLMEELARNKTNNRLIPNAAATST
jgi:hypothetical protein